MGRVCAPELLGITSRVGQGMGTPEPPLEGDPEAEAAHRHGLGQLTDIFLDCVVENIEDRLRTGNRLGAARSARVLMLERPERWAAMLESSREAAELAEELATPAEGSSEPSAENSV